MSKKSVLVVSCELRETRVALIEAGIIAELHIERRGQSNSGTVGNVILGKVTRVLPGLQAAFVDIGQERAAFLHVEDLIRPADFEAYLYGTPKKETEKTVQAGADDVAVKTEASGAESQVPQTQKSVSRRIVAATEQAEEVPATEIPEDRESRQAMLSELDRPSVPFLVDRPSQPELPRLDLLGLESGPSLGAAPEAEDSDEDFDDAGDESGEGDDGDAEDGTEDGESAPRSETFVSEETSGKAPKAGLPAAEFDFPEIGFTVSDPNEPTPRAHTRQGGQGQDRGRGRRGRGRNGRSGGRNEGDRGGRDNKRSHGPNPLHQNRISKQTPIEEVVKEGQEIIVQVSKDPIGTKGARCTSHVSLPGRYVIYLPTVDHIGISKRIGSERERARLKETIEGIKPPKGGLIVRTVAEGLTKKQLKQDIGYLVRLWEDIASKREGSRSPTVLMSELDLVLKTARDLFTDEVEKIVIDDRAQYERMIRFVEMFAPDRIKHIEFYSGEEPIFDAYGIEDEIQRALSRKVPLPSGGYLVIDQAEALTAIDVNTGRFVGKGSKDLEETILKTNLEAVHEIAYQLRFRNIGGLIILDLIDMEKQQSREKVRRELESLLQKDKAKTSLNRISDLGLIEMTRKRTRESLGRLLHEPCFYCDGTGQLQSKETIAFEILREIRRRRSDLPGYRVVVNAHPAVAEVLMGAEKAALADTENKFQRQVIVTPRKEYHYEQFDLQGK